MELSLIEVNIHDFVDQPTLATYLSGNTELILEKNRPFYPNSTEVCIDGVYFALTSFQEKNIDFTMLSLYKRSPRQKKTYRYAFGCFDKKNNKIYWFFNAQSIAESRDIALRVINKLQDWCKENEPTFTPFAFKK